MPENMPESLQFVKDFANSMDVEDGVDDLDSPAKAKSWFAAHGLGEPRITRAELGRLHEFRAGLRALLLANHGDPLDANAVARMNEAAGKARLAVQFGDDGVARVDACPSGVDEILGGLLASILLATAEGTWERLKLCKNDRCAVVFYDLSKNHSRAWCSMAVCGNRMKVKSYRERHLAENA